MERPGAVLEGDAPVGSEDAWRLRCLCRQLAPVPRILALLREADPALGTETQGWALRHLLRDATLQAVGGGRDCDHATRLLRGIVSAAMRAGSDVDDELASELVRWSGPESGGDGEVCCGGALGPTEGPRPRAALLPLSDGSDGWRVKLWSYLARGPDREDPSDVLAAYEARTASSGVAAGDAATGLVALRVSRDILAGGTGCHEWEAGFLLAEWVLGEGWRAGAEGAAAGRDRGGERGGVEGAALAPPGPEAGASGAERAPAPPPASSVRDLRVLELGCGAGLVGVALARAGAAQVLLTDHNSHALETAHDNLARNGVEARVWSAGEAWGGGEGHRGEPAPVPASSGAFCASAVGGPDPASRPDLDLDLPAVSVGQLDWARPPPRVSPDIILGSDLLYDPSAIEPLLGLLDALLGGEAAASGRAGRGEERARGGPEGVVGQPYALLVTTLRNEETLASFVRAAEAHPRLAVRELAHGRTPAGVPAFQHEDRLEGARTRIKLHQLWKAR